ncbi:hypothetical protein [Evansella cellulosilytica]|uniref:Uncharacterized protein n=1 Tax=Evansella cellulosilytica (strain ATCC 21833 / DSM 2522 / FERM P-1141 / JCM 9156 / N-4) TaxID=649639 RepID=E6TYX9_EVAC2|nr:hypothetical protein [Evansella cellulosilytica]ADU31314.1 hypothetical protein Bcell_3069 [Evansella cellulosilytica DSM 2522]
MDNYLLLAIIALKGVCLFFCWKAISVSSKQNKQVTQNNLSKEETELLNERMNKAFEQNQLLQKELQQLREHREKL